MKQISVLLMGFLFLCGTSLGDQIDDAVLARNAGHVQEAKETLLPLARSGSARAQFELGMSYSRVGDDEVGWYWIEEAAKGGYALAATMLGMSYMSSESKSEQEKATYWLQRAVELGDDTAKQFLEVQLASTQSQCEPTPESLIPNSTWIIYDETDEMTDERHYRLISKSVAIGAGTVRAYVAIEVNDEVISISSSRPMGRNKQIGVRVDTGSYYAAEVVVIQNGPEDIYMAAKAKQAGLITEEQLANVRRTGNIDGIMPDPPRYLRIAPGHHWEYRNLIEEMKRGNQMKLRVFFDGEAEGTILTFSLIGFTRAYQSFQSCLKFAQSG